MEIVFEFVSENRNTHKTKRRMDGGLLHIIFFESRGAYIYALICYYHSPFDRIKDVD